MLSLEPALAAEACRLYVLATLVAATVGKARDPPAFQASVVQLVPVPRPLAGAAAGAVVIAEVGLAVALMAGGRWAAGGLAGALLLFGAFAALIAAALVRRRAVSCSCFGPSPRRIGVFDLARSLSLAAASGYALQAGAGTRLAPLAEALLFAGLLLLVLLSVRLQEALAERGVELTVGRPIPDFRGGAPDAEAPVGREIFDGQPAVVAFVAAGCPKCRATVSSLREMLGAMARAGVALWIVPIGLERRDFPEVTQDTQLARHLLRIGLADCRRLNPHVTAPYYLFVDHLGVVQAAGVVGDEDWRSFAGQIAAEAA